MEWKNLYRGMIMGVTDLIPGVSGGTMAVVLGIYDRLLEAISGFFSKEWKRHLGFLVPLGIGVVIALLSLSRLIDYLLKEYFEPTQFFFIGLIIGVIPFLIRHSEAKRYFTTRHIIALIIAAVLVASMAFIKTDTSAEPIESLTILSAIGLFLSGWLASMAMLLPGISGSFILLLLGVYSTAIRALSTLDLPFIAVIGAGVVFGFIMSSKGIRYMLSHFHHMTFAVIIGLIIGSIAVVYPGVSGDIATNIISALTFVAGLLLTLAFGAKSN